MKNKSRTSITAKLLVIVLGLLFATISILAYYNEQHFKTSFISYTDEKLELAVYAANDYMLRDYHDKILDKNSIEDEDYHEMMFELSSFVTKTDLKYVYSFVKRDDKILVTSTSVTQDDFTAGNYEEFFEEYDSVSQKVIDAFEKKAVVHEETKDKYGYVRTIMIPFENKYGDVYLVGADIDMKNLESEISNSRMEIILISAVIFIVSTILYLFFSKRVLKRIPIIRNSLEEFFDYMNSKTDEVSMIQMKGNDELNEMADMINKNIELIGANIKKDNQLIKEIASISNGVKRGVFTSTIQKEGNNPALNEVKDIFNDVMIDMQKVLMDILYILKEFSKQNYSCKLQEYDLDGEMGKLIEQMNIFGKDISTNMLNTAYDSLNLDKDSKFTNEYMFELKNKFAEYLKTINNMKDDVSNLYRYSSKSLQKIEVTSKESLLVEKLFINVMDEYKELSSQLKRQDNLEMLEKFDDINHSLISLRKYFDDMLSLNNMSVEIHKRLDEDIEEFEENILSGNNSIDQMQKVSNNLNALSEKMKTKIENAQFNGKDNILMLMNYSDK